MVRLSETEIFSKRKSEFPEVRYRDEYNGLSIYIVMDSWKAREIRIRRGTKKWLDRIQVWMVNWTGPGPGVRSTDLVLGQDKGPAERDNDYY